MTWIIKRTNQFKKNYKSLPEHIQEKFKINFLKFLDNPYNPSLKTHKLKWKLSEYTSSSINDNYRFITKIIIEDNEIRLIDIWTHEIYK